MRALIEEYAAAFTCPSGSPLARVVVSLRTVPVCDYPVRAADLAHLSAPYDLAHLAVDAVSALIHHDTEDELGVLVGNLHHLKDLKPVDSGGLFRYDMKSAFHALNGIGRVEVVRNGNEDRLCLSAVKQLFRARIAVHGRADAFRPLKAFGKDIRDGGKLYFGAFSRHDVLYVAGAHITDTDDTEFYFSFHSDHLLIYYSRPKDFRYS